MFFKTIYRGRGQNKCKVSIFTNHITQILVAYDGLVVFSVDKFKKCDKLYMFRIFVDTEVCGILP